MFTTTDDLQQATSRPRWRQRFSKEVGDAVAVAIVFFAAMLVAANLLLFQKLAWYANDSAIASPNNCTIVGTRLPHSHQPEKGWGSRGNPLATPHFTTLFYYIPQSIRR